MFEFKHLINSRKSLLKGIWVSPLPKLAENVDPLLRGHLSAGQCIRRVGFFEAVEDPYDFLHLFHLIARRPHESAVVAFTARIPWLRQKTPPSRDNPPAGAVAVSPLIEAGNVYLHDAEWTRGGARASVGMAAPAGLEPALPR